MKTMRKILMVAAIAVLAVLSTKGVKAATVHMNFGKEYTASFTGDNYQYYEFTMEKDGLLTFDNTLKTSGDSISVYLYNGNDYNTEFDYYRLGGIVSRYQTKRSVYLRKGTYCFGIRGYWSYSKGDLAIKATPTYLNTTTKSNIDTYENAQWLSSGKRITGLHAIDKKQSWFKFSLNKAKVVSFIYAPNKSGDDMVIYSSSLKVLNRLGSSQYDPVSYSKKMSAGTYYVALRNSNANKFTLYYKTNEVPSAMTVKSVKAMKSAMKVYLKKQSGVTRYQVQYATKSNFSGAKTITTTSTSVSVKKLKSKKYYYVRSRAYVRVSDVNHYGSWGNVKKVKIK